MIATRRRSGWSSPGSKSRPSDGPRDPRANHAFGVAPIAGQDRRPARQRRNRVERRVFAAQGGEREITRGARIPIAAGFFDQHQAIGVRIG
jgi:hypothetical protein